MKYTIKRATVEDVDRLQKISRKTFFETYSTLNSDKDMEEYLEKNFSIKTLTMELNNNNSQFYFAELDDRTLGYLKLNFGQSQTDLKDDQAVEIERIYVLKEFQGKEAGQLLYQKAVQIANDLNMDFVWLGVWEKNPRAISFYKKNGFVEFGKHLFKLGNDMQIDFMMKLQLK